MSSFTQDLGNWGAAKKFRLVLREQGMTREMGGSEMSLAVSFVDNIMMQALDVKASDIHLQPERDQLRIRFRQDGILTDNGMLPPEQAANVLARLKLAAGMRIDEQRETQDGRIDMEYNGRRLSARASCVPCLNGEKFVMRLLDPQAMKVNLDDLGMPPHVQERWEKAISVPYGMILVTGPTGSGKTSSLYASLNKLDSRTRNIVTVEDPIEYEFDQNIAQVQVTEKLTFPRVMRSFLRQDPDVMMVGEIRDPESLAIAIQASLTGHLVLATLHTNNSIEAVGRMIDMGAQDYLVGGVITAIMAQRLVRRIDPATAQPFPYKREDLEEIGITAEHMAGARLMKGAPGPTNNGTGYRGRVGIYEIIMGDRALKNAITHRATFDQMLEVVKAQGFRSMLDDGRDKVLQGVTTPDEVMRAVSTQALE
jgi:type II secretory ATPase GspE/PulE/Tfp pilus assembly ATPase PilB-like protein